MKEIEHQLELGEEGLAEEDKFLLECNFDELATTNGEQQEYWILAIEAAREACRLRATARSLAQRSGLETTDGNIINAYAWHHLVWAEQFPGIRHPGRREPSLRGSDCNAVSHQCLWHKDSFRLNWSRL